MYEVKIFVAGPIDGIPAQQRIYRFARGQSHFYRDKGYIIDAFHWKTHDHRQITDSHTTIQSRIDNHYNNPLTCDIFIAFFKIVARRDRVIGPNLFQKTFKEIDIALGRSTIPRMVILYEDAPTSPKVDEDDIDGCLEDYKTQLKACAEMRKRIEAVLLPHRERTGLDLRPQRLTPEQVEGGLESILGELVKPLIDEVHQSRTSDTDAGIRRPLEPYVGLRELTIGNFGIFFGQHDARNAILNALRRAPELRLVVVQGASGTGKSSLIKAGLLHSIVHDQALPGRPHWAFTQFNPTDANIDPFHALVLRCHSPDGGPINEIDQIVDDLRRACSQGIEAAQQCLRTLLGRMPGGNCGLIIVVNQLEELWGAASAVRQSLLTLIAAAAQTPDFLVLASLRSDRLTEFVETPSIVPLLQQQQAIVFPLAPPTLKQLEEMIVRPAAEARLQLEDGLAYRIAVEIQRFGGDFSLPILAAFMRSIWKPEEHAPPRTMITHIDFEAVGSPTNIIRTLVTRISAGHAPPSLQWLFDRLVDVRDGRCITIHAPLGRLINEDGERQGLIDELASKARVLVISGDGEDAKVRLAHESLFELWPDLKHWVETSLDDLRMRDELVREARIWDERGRNAAPPRMSNDRLHDIGELEKERPELFASENKLLRSYLDRCHITREREYLIYAVKGGHISHAVQSLRKLKRLLPSDELVLDDFYRGTESSVESWELRPQFWAAITGDDSDRSASGKSIFDGPKGKARFDDEEARRQTPLSWAAAMGQIDLIKKLVKLGADLKKKDLKGGSLLHSAACGGDMATIQYLVAQGLDPKVPDLDGNFPLLWAINHGNKSAAEFLRERTPVNIQLEEGWNEFTEAARSNDLARMKELVGDGAFSTDYRIPTGVTVLHVAVASDRAVTNDVILWLIENGAPLDAKDKFDQTAVHYASFVGNAHAVDMLAIAAKSRRIDLLDAKDQFGQTALHTAARNRQLHIAHRLLDHGADPNIKDNDNCTALSLAIYHGNTQIVRLLLASQSYIHSSSYTITHIIWAIQAVDCQLLGILLRDMPSEALNMHRAGNTLIGQAAETGNVKIVRMLLDRGADPRISGHGGLDALDTARAADQAEAAATIATWARQRPEFNEWLISKERNQASVEIGSYRPTLALPIPANVPVSMEALRDEVLRGVDEARAANIISGIAASASLDMVEVALDLLKPVLQSAGLDAAATAAGARGLSAIVWRLVEAGAAQPWWWQRRKITEERLSFLPFADFTDQLPGPSAAPWHKLPTPPEFRRIRVVKLPFLLDRRLVVVESVDCPGRNETFFLERSAGTFEYLNWSNSCIYETAEEGISISKKNARQYVRWFFAMVRSDVGGSFHIVENADNIPWLSDADPEVRDRVTDLIKPLRLVRNTSEQLILRGSVFFRNALFASSIRIVLQSGINLHEGRAQLGQMQLEREKLLLEDLPIAVDGPLGLFG